jgi:hypothetical protein
MAGRGRVSLEKEFLRLPAPHMAIGPTPDCNPSTMQPCTPVILQSDRGCIGTRGEISDCYPTIWFQASQATGLQSRVVSVIWLERITNVASVAGICRRLRNDFFQNFTPEFP